ncbi:MAG: molybdopterin converting factor subunit 1 [Pseudomonadota bacterium]|nr:molybdopterin converting factor subunit 1 [Pseudomonadota bacterium]
MIKVLFFARVRDQVGCSELEVELPDTVSNVGAFTDLLKSRSQACCDALSNPNILVAVNQEMASSQTTVEDGDEVAYFPPVTGG